MGSGNSQMVSDTPRRIETPKRTIKRTISSMLICGASTSRSPNEIKDYQAELLENSSEHGHMEKLKFLRNDSDLSLSCRGDLTSIKSENGILSGRYIAASGNPVLEIGPCNVEPGGQGKSLCESRELVPICQLIANPRSNQSPTTSYLDQPSPDYVSANEIICMDAVNRMNMSIDPSHVGEKITNQHCVFPRRPGESMLDEVSAENNVSETNYGSNTYFDSSNSHSPRDDITQGSLTPGLGFRLSEREQNRHNGSLLQVDLVGISSSILSSSSSEISSHEVRRNSRRLFWDAFSRRSSRRRADLRTVVFSPDDSNHFRSRDIFNGEFVGDETGDDSRYNDSSSQSSNEPRWGSRSQIWERYQGSLNSTNRQIAVCPRGIHPYGSCLCQSSLSSEDSAPRGGISRVVMLAEALFEVLDQIHQQPISLSLSMVSIPALESVVDSFPVKAYKKTESLECADDVSQCYICLSEYEEGDKIRILPCYHEYHKSCVDKWLKEIHGVCPLCRANVSQGSTSTESSVSNVLVS